MNINCSPQRVIVKKCGQTAMGNVVGNCHIDMLNEKGEVFAGAHIGILVQLDSLHMVYAQKEQLEAVAA